MFVSDGIFCWNGDFMIRQFLVNLEIFNDRDPWDPLTIFVFEFIIIDISSVRINFYFLFGIQIFQENIKLLSSF